MEIHAGSLLHAHTIWMVEEVDDDGKRTALRSFTGPRAQQLAGIYARRQAEKRCCNVVIED